MPSVNSGSPYIFVIFNRYLSAEIMKGLTFPSHPQCDFWFSLNVDVTDSLEVTFFMKKTSGWKIGE